MTIVLKYTSPAINGDVTTKGFEQQIEITSFQYGIGRAIGSPTGASGNREASTPSISEINCTKMHDTATADLIKESLSGAGKATAVFSWLRTDGGSVTCYQQITLTDVMISSYSMSSGGDRPSESFSLNFVTIETKVTPQKDDGTAGSPKTVKRNLGTNVTS